MEFTRSSIVDGSGILSNETGIGSTLSIFLFIASASLSCEFFNLESRLNTNTLSKSVKFFGNNKIINNFFTRFADNGLVI